jgi:polysaccharide biosynthesis protein PelF
MIGDLASADLSVQELLHGEGSFRLAGEEIYRALSPDAPFIDFFWHFRAMHVPLLRMLAAPCPAAEVYHAVSAGYAGLLGAMASQRTGRPLILTEHGIYAREREMELARASWIRDIDAGIDWGEVTLSPLRELWSHYFRMLSRIAYHQAATILTLSEVNRAKQLADGAEPAKTEVVPNGVDLDLWSPAGSPSSCAEPSAAGPALAPARPMRVGFVGRVVPIKDVITLIRACALALHRADLEMWIIGPQVEDPPYVRRCVELVDTLGLGSRIEFLGPRPAAEIYPQLDLIILTSLSEGQPLVILEAHAAGLPVIATDVGACRELLEGVDGVDRDLGPSGIVTGVANPAAIADALVTLARDPALRRAMGRAGRERVVRSYQLSGVIGRYDAIYSDMLGRSQASA